jgi:Tfp pilus assembly protein PilX
MTYATPTHRSASSQRGVVLIFTLIVLLILTIGAVALLRSTNSSLFSAGNLAFRRDLVNQGEQAVSNVLNQFKTGGALVSATSNSLASANYSASMLATNQQGVPLALLNATTFGTVGLTANDIVGATPDVVIRYVIDRMCTTSGPSSAAICVQSSAAPTGGTAVAIAAPITPPTATVYRLSVRVSGPRSTQVFLQTTFTKPDWRAGTAT